MQFSSQIQELLDLSQYLMHDYPRTGYQPALKYYRAIAYEKLGRHAASTYALETLLIEYPAHPQTSDIMAKLAQVEHATTVVKKTKH